MTVYVVRAGDTLTGIARRHGIRHWPNIYFATENTAFRASHFNPDRIRPGERIGIPTAASIAPMERSPVVVHRHIPLFTQTSETCWRATGKMLYCNRNPGRAADFDRLIGREYQESTRGLETSRWHDFYAARLGMTESIIASPNDLHFRIATRGPVIAAIGDGASAHSMVAAGYDLSVGRWLVLDPAAGEELTFADDAISAGSTPASGDDDTATLTAYRTGPATWANMHRWLWILDTTIHQKIYHY